MKILRLRLRHYRGIEEREIELAPRGVTIIVGPNEVGKSSLAEAVLLLFDELDNTAKQRVREIRPVDRDEGSEVEADVELGDFAFTYTKRFHRRPATHLAIRSPRVETRTGREAHERVCALLDSQVDVALWRALRIVQGEPLALPELGEATSLAEALDRAAGVSGGGEREESLFEAARLAFDEHFTATGRPRRELVALEEAVESAMAEERALGEELESLERDVENERALRRRLAELEQQRAAERLALREADAAVEALGALRHESTRLEAQLEAARAEERQAVSASRQRGQLLSSQAGAAAEVESLAEALESEEPAHIAAAAELRHIEERLEEAQALRGRCAEVAERARRDAAFRRGEKEQSALRERLERVAREREELARTRAVLAGPPIDEARVTEIQSEQLGVERARARLAAEGPLVQIAPEIALELHIDGRRERLRAGEPIEARVGEALTLSLPGVGEIRVVAGAGVSERRKALEQAETRLRGLCMEIGVDDHAGAIAALAARRAARGELERGQERLARSLGPDSAESLEARAEQLVRRMRRYTEEREGDVAASGDPTPLPASVEAAEQALERAEGEAHRAREHFDALASRRAELETRFQRSDRQRSDTRTRLELAERNRVDLSERLAAARDEVDDDQVDERLEACTAKAREVEASAQAAAARLAERRPDETERAARQRRDALDALERSLREQRDAHLRLCERLEVVGRDGLYERWQAAQRSRERAERARSARLRRADAAGRLFELLRSERDAARSHYAAPLAEQIARLGRPVYGDDFDVELDDELRVARRVLDGKSLAVSQLSAGAREQLGLLSRLAAAHIAGGVPLWLDDALGHSDPDRLAALAPLLAAAGEAGQVVVLTCSPERFRDVPGARILELH